MPEVVIEKLRTRQPLDDAEVDRLYPDWARRLSTIHWTPVEVARRAAELLVARSGMRVLDVGAGVGKFCVIGALTTDAVFYGIEQRRPFVEAANALAGALGARTARFLHGNMTALDWRGFDGFYLYNPFAEHLPAMPDRIDDTVQADLSLHDAHVDFVRRKLRAAEPGTRVVTYHGFGGELPENYALVHREPIHTGPLEVWVATSGDPAPWDRPCS